MISLARGQVGEWQTHCNTCFESKEGQGINLKHPRQNAKEDNVKNEVDEANPQKLVVKFINALQKLRRIKRHCLQGFMLVLSFELLRNYI